MLALLDGIPADVVVISHRGLDQFASFSDLAKAAPLRTAIEITAWRTPIDQIPAGWSIAVLARRAERPATADRSRDEHNSKAKGSKTQG